MLRVYFAFVLLSLLALACGSSTPSPTLTPEESAWTACTLFVEQQVGLSMRAAQRYAPERVTETADGMYEVRVFYAEPGQTYRCEISRQAGGNWELSGLEVR